MWLITHTTTGQHFYLLTAQQKYSVGRTHADIQMMDDNTISRTHAIIYVSPYEVKIEDPGSKYGVFLNSNDIKLNLPISKNEPKILQIGDVVRFGRFNNIWRLEKIAINCCTSTIDTQDMAQLNELLRTVNGNVQRTWNELCTHLVMPNVTVTIKVLQSLANGVPIVTPLFWKAYADYAKENRQQLPDVNDFVPPINEQFIIKDPRLLHVNLRRQRLFQGKTLVFMLRSHMLVYESVIKLAQGECDFLQNNPFRKENLLNKDYIPIVYKMSDQSQNTQDIDSVIDYIVTNGRRVVSESEISLAILYCSIERYCNPDYRMQKFFEMETVDLTKVAGAVLAEETPALRAPELLKASDIFVPESVDVTDEIDLNNRIDSSAVYSENADQVECEKMDESNQLARPSTSGMYLGKRGRHRSDDKCADDENAAKRSKSNVPVPKEKNRRRSDEPPVVDGNAAKKSKSYDAVAEKIADSSNFEPHQSQSQSQSFSGFLTTQNRFKIPPVAPAVAAEQSQQTQIDSAERRKRALDLLNVPSNDEDNNNDDDDNPFKLLRKKAAKQPRLNRVELARTNDADDTDGFDFPSRPSQRIRGGLSQQKATAPNASSAANTTVFMPFKRSAIEKTIGMTHVRPVEATTDGWLSCAFKKDVSVGNGTESATVAAALPTKIKIKEEKLEEWEMTDEQKKQKWLKSLDTAIQVKTFNVTFTRRSDSSVGDETDANTAATKNFKTFVKKHNYIVQTRIVRTNPVNISINPFGRI